MIWLFVTFRRMFNVKVLFATLSDPRGYMLHQPRNIFWLCVDKAEKSTDRKRGNKVRFVFKNGEESKRLEIEKKKLGSSVQEFCITSSKTRSNVTSWLHDISDKMTHFLGGDISRETRPKRSSWKECIPYVLWNGQNCITWEHENSVWIV